VRHFFNHREKEDEKMAMDMLRRLANSPLPATFHASEEVDQIMVLRAAGLLIALTPAPPGPSLGADDGDTAQVIALTQKGRDELAKFFLPGDDPAQSGSPSFWRAKLNPLKHWRRGG
jgi:hypothetical protein